MIGPFFKSITHFTTMENNNRKIAENTIFLYFRMMLTMAVTLYTSRVTLKVLGNQDFGIYQTVCGAVTFLAFLSNALGTGTSRFITYEMGKERPGLDILFSTAMLAHIILGFAVVIAGEIIGLGFLYDKLMIPADRLDAAVVAFHFSMAATFFQIIRSPYDASIIAHEKMNVYAWISILEVSLKLIIVYVLLAFGCDKLKLYAALMCAVTILLFITYRSYCRKIFDETRTKPSFDSQVLKSVASFSGWNLLSSSAASLAGQGVTVVTNMFFAPGVVTVRSLALKINDVLNQFIGSFRLAVNPQIVKKYASGDREGSRRLALVSASCTYYLMLMVAVPLFLLTEPLLYLWLGEVPDTLSAFVRLAIVQALFQALDTSLYAPIYAKGQIRENAIISPLFDFVQLPVIYFLFKHGYPPITLAWVSASAYLILGVIIKPLMVRWIAGYDYPEVMRMVLKCMAVTLIASVLPFTAAYLVKTDSVPGFVFAFLVSVVSTGFAIWFIGIDKTLRKMITEKVKERFL